MLSEGDASLWVKNVNDSKEFASLFFGVKCAVGHAV